jgi:hypothetical protein
MTVRRACRAALGCTLIIAMAACAPTARTAGPYAAKAVKTADAMHSAVASDLVLLGAVEQHHTFSAFVSESTSQAEDAGSSAASTFLSIQPPDDKSDQLRDQLSELLDDAQSALGDARIAARRGDRAALLKTKSDLEDVDKRLQDFAQAHQ